MCLQMAKLFEQISFRLDFFYKYNTNIIGDIFPKTIGVRILPNHSTILVRKSKKKLIITSTFVATSLGAFGIAHTSCITACIHGCEQVYAGTNNGRGYLNCVSGCEAAFDLGEQSQSIGGF